MKIVIAAEFTHSEEDRLNELGFETLRNGWGATGKTMVETELIDALVNASVLITEHDEVTRAVIEASPSLELIISCRGTPVGIDIDAANEHAISVSNTPARNADAVADFTLGCIINAVRQIATSDRHHRAHGWAVNDKMPYLHFRGNEMRNLTLGLVGLGAIGERVAKRARLGFDMRVLATTRTPQEIDGVSEVDLATLLRESDIISLHCPLNDSTRGLIGQPEIDQMKPGSYLVNLARGEIVDTNAMITALKSGHLAAAVLDVYHPEPPDPTHELFDTPGLTLTPHIAGASEDVVRNQSRSAVTQLEQWLAIRTTQHGTLTDEPVATQDPSHS